MELFKNFDPRPNDPMLAHLSEPHPLCGLYRAYRDATYNYAVILMADGLPLDREILDLVNAHLSNDARKYKVEKGFQRDEGRGLQVKYKTAKDALYRKVFLPFGYAVPELLQALQIAPAADVSDNSTLLWQELQRHVAGLVAEKIKHDYPERLEATQFEGVPISTDDPGRKVVHPARQTLPPGKGR